MAASKFSAVSDIFISPVFDYCMYTVNEFDIYKEDFHYPGSETLLELDVLLPKVRKSIENQASKKKVYLDYQHLEYILLLFT